MENEKQLWTQFNLAENNPGLGGGILYCLRYALPRIEGHQEVVVDTLKGLGVCIVEEGDKLGLKFRSEYATNKDQNSLLRRVNALVEELSCLNEAIEYSRAGFGDCRTIEDLKNKLMCSYFEIFEKGSHVEAYDLVDFTIPRMVRDITIADRQNKVLSSKDRKSLEELSTFAKRQAEHMNDPRGYVLFG